MTVLEKETARAVHLSVGADKDISDFKLRLKAHEQALNAQRKTQREHGDLLKEHGRRLEKIESTVEQGFARVDQGFAKQALGQDEITKMLTRILEDT